MGTSANIGGYGSGGTYDSSVKHPYQASSISYQRRY